MKVSDRIRLSRAYARLRPLVQRAELLAWQIRGRPVPVPHLLKQRLVASYAERYGRRVLVETGTFLGTMVRSQLGRFDEIVSIELDPRLAARARVLFARRPEVRVLEGDSAALLPGIVAELTVPALFWLDAHDSGGFTARGPKETPLAEELACVLSRAVSPVVLVDDAHLMTGRGNHGCRGDWPTVEWVRSRGELAGLHVELEADVIRLTPRV